MISEHAKITIRRISLDCIQVKEYQVRYVKRLRHYIKLMKKHPKMYAGLLYLVPSDTHAGMFALLDGHTRFCSYIMTGHPDALCAVEEEVTA
jgi:hypothetical protein